MKFIHIADAHIGAWRNPKMKTLTYKAFEEVITKTILEEPDFLLISGDLFHTAIPDVDTLKLVVKELQRLKNKNIPVYIIAGSHDFSPSGKTMLDVLEEASLVKNVTRGEVVDDKLKLLFTTDPKTNIKITGLLGKRGNLDKYYYEDLDRKSLEEEDGKKIFMFHTAITELKPKKLEDMNSNPISFLPKGFNYYAGGHVHITKEISIPDYNNVVYPGPVFPANFSELEELKAGFYVVVDDWNIERKKIIIKEVLKIFINGNNKSSSEINIILKNKLNNNFNDKIVLLRIEGKIREGDVKDIDINKFIEEAYEKGAYFVTKNSSKLRTKEFEEQMITPDSELDIENSIIKEHLGQELIDLSNDEELKLIKNLMQSLSKEIIEGEKKYEYEKRIINEADKLIKTDQ